MELITGNILVDSHCHLDELVDYRLEQGILPVACGHSHASNRKTVAIATKWKLPYVLGMSPQAAQKEGVGKREEWAAYIRAQRPCAIGEIGLDFHWAKTTEQKEMQYRVFEGMLDLAKEMQLPIVLHCREAGDEMLDRLEGRLQRGAMWHFFSGSEAQAKRALEMGIYLSFPPLPSGARKKALELAPLEKILAETDAPAGARLPSEVRTAIAYIANVKGLSVEQVEKQTAKNAAALFRLEI